MSEDVSLRIESLPAFRATNVLELSAVRSRPGHCQLLKVTLNDAVKIRYAKMALKLTKSRGAKITCRTVACHGAQSGFSRDLVVGDRYKKNRP